jgi:hypothetical protein
VQARREVDVPATQDHLHHVGVYGRQSAASPGFWSARRRERHDPSGTRPA